MFFILSQQRTNSVFCILQTGSNTYADDSCVAFSYTWELTSPLTSSLSQTRTWHIQLVSHLIRHAIDYAERTQWLSLLFKISQLVFRPSSLSKPYLFSNSRYLYKILYNEEDDYFYFKTVNVNASNRDGRLVQINKNKSSGALTL